MRAIKKKAKGTWAQRIKRVSDAAKAVTRRIA